MPLGNPIDLSCPHAVAIFDRFAPDGAAKHGRRAVALASGAKLLQASFPKLSREKSSTHPRRKADRPSPLMRRAVAAQQVEDLRNGRETKNVRAFCIPPANAINTIRPPTQQSRQPLFCKTIHLLVLSQRLSRVGGSPPPQRRIGPKGRSSVSSKKLKRRMSF